MFFLFDLRRNKIVGIELDSGEVNVPGGGPETPHPHGDRVLTGPPQQASHWVLSVSSTVDQGSIHQAAVVRILEFICHLDPIIPGGATRDAEC